MGMKKYRVCMGVEKNGVLRRRSQVELSRLRKRPLGELPL